MSVRFEADLALGALCVMQAMSVLRHHLPKNAVLVGQNIKKDVEWLDVCPRPPLPLLPFCCHIFL